MKKIYCYLILFIGFSVCLTSIASGQGVGINSSNNPPDPSAILDLSSTTKGLFMPRMTTVQRDSIVSPQEGLMIWNTTTHCLDVYVVNAWQGLICGCASAPATPGSITGSTNVCSNATGNIYSISAVFSAMSYTWNVPSGSIITAGQGTPSITVTFGSNSGAITVTANNGCGSSSSASQAITITSGPAVPTANAASNITCSGFTASWSPSSGATAYYLDVASDASFNNFLSGYNNLNVGNVLFENLTGLSQNTSYYYRVRASNSCGTSGNSSTITAAIYQPYIAITLTNNQSTATGTNFQQMITVNSSTYSSYESSGLENIEFTTGPYATGTVLQAWIESGATNSSTSTLYWVNLGSNSIPGNSSLTIYMNFMPTNVMSASGPTGKAPQLTTPYGLYDNGASVFNLYTNWAGTSLPSGWTTSISGASYSVNNGLTCNGSGGSVFVYYNTQLNPVGSIIETYYQSGTALSDAHDALIGWGVSFSGGTGGLWWGWSSGAYAGLHNTIEVGAVNGSSGSGVNGSVFSYPIVISLSWQSSSSETLYSNYANPITNSSSLPTMQNAYPIGGYISSGGTVTYKWFKKRVYPPGGVMPGVSFSSVGC